MSSKAFTAGWLVAATVLSSWAVSSASDEPLARPVRALAPAAQPLPELTVAVNAEIARLASRTAYVVPEAANTRDLFTFARRSNPRRGTSRAAAVSKFPSASVSSEREESLREADALPDVANVPTQPTLSGVAEMTSGVFTAVISFGGDLLFMRKGDVIGGRYRIDAIALDGVDIFDLTLGTISRLRLHL